MSALTVPDDWEGGLDDLVEQANSLLPLILPETSKPSRVREEVNPRLVRHYTTQGLLDEPHRAGREARYTRRHLLQLLALRQLMSRGHSAGAAQELLHGRSDEDLLALLEGSSQVDLAPPPPTRDNPALRYLQRLHSPPPAAVHAAPPQPLFAPPTNQERWTHLRVQHGLELHVRDDWRAPKSPAERDRLARTLTELLAQLGRK